MQNVAGELDWVRQMIDKFDATARGTGAKIVSCCGHDSVTISTVVSPLEKVP